MATNVYINGSKHLVLRSRDITAAWGKGPFYTKRIALANTAFCVYYHAKKKIDDMVLDPKHSQMAASLRNCLRSGYHFNPMSDCDDLEEVFNHVVKNRGKYKDSKTADYNGGPQTVLPMRVPNGPKGCVNFLKAIDSERAKLKAAAIKLATETQKLSRMPKPASGSKSDHDKIKQQLGKIKSAADATQHMMWLVNTEVNARVPSGSLSASGLAKIGSATEKGMATVGRTLKFVDVLGKINDGMKAYDATLRAGGSDSTAKAVAALNVAVSYVPIISSFYGPIIQGVPGLIASMTSVIGSNAHSAANLNSLRAKGGAHIGATCPQCKLPRRL